VNNVSDIGTPATCGATNIHNPNKTYGSLTDQQGNIYKTIVIGTQEWMAENLNTSIYRNGDTIPNVFYMEPWTLLSTGAWSHPDANSQYECPYGKLYNWYAIADPRNVCPIGWHVPSDAEWNILIGFLDPSFNPNADGFPSFQSATAGGKMKSIGLQYWIDPNTDATNESGFSGLPAGIRIGGAFGSRSENSAWWSSSESMPLNFAWNRIISNSFGNVYRVKYTKGNGLSVRCIKD
jgi:uncharacterized protein (TIGR02145 family)